VLSKHQYATIPFGKGSTGYPGGLWWHWVNGTGVE
jgi:hypothetical protein